MNSKQTKKRHVYFSGRKSKKKGRLVINASNSSCKYLQFKYLKLKKNATVTHCFQKLDSIIVLLKGRIHITVDGQPFTLGPRKDVFSAKSSSIYIPRKHPFLVKAQGVGVEIALINTPLRNRRFKKVTIAQSKQVSVKTVGRGTYRRKVHTLFPYVTRPKKKAQKGMGNNAYILVGETFNEAGKWSSFPPHRHAYNKLPHESQYEEIYFCKVVPEDGFGFIRIYDKKKKSTERVYCIKNNDCFVVTHGYHPVCAAPGCQVYYLWALAGRHGTVINAYDPVFL
ncbi:MAG: 5-deoxy-glucuronate isomerase [Candidatus Omnitrophica bacterium]|nr:5-deoxy-glucuronate isomerase [Candidatus Omnitrophota bacterium]